MTDTPKHSVSVAGIVVDDQDRVLVIQRRDNGHWEPPGGVLELDETFEEGVEREVYEETGVKVAVQALSGVYKNMALGVVAMVFRCEPISGSVALSAETTSVRWMGRAAAEGAMAPAYAVRISDAFSNSTVTRSHDGIDLV